MKKIILALSVVCLGFTVMNAQNQKTAPAVTAIGIGTHLPAGQESYKGTDGKQYTLDGSLTKQGLIVMFSCNTCPYVIKSQQRTKETIELAKKTGLGIVIVNSNINQRGDADSYDAMVKYAKEQGYTAPYIEDDGKLAAAFGATRTPEVFLFDGNGNLFYKGAMEDNPSDPSNSKQFYLRNAVSNLVAGVPADPASTRSIGCSIKNNK